MTVLYSLRRTVMSGVIQAICFTPALATTEDLVKAAVAGDLVTVRALLAKELSKNYFYNLARSVRGCLLIRPDPDGTIA